MERVTRKYLDFIREHKKTRINKMIEKNKKEVEINGHGSHRYMIKEGINKGKIL
tara:strand:+ start:107 stop:268 length:162 start_codon:yes stop_codon:yes gene_type:complete